MNSAESLDLLVVTGLTVTGHLREVSIRVKSGEIHSVFGDEPEHKTLLMKVLAGEIPATDGIIIFNGKPLRKHSSRKALHLGIEIIDSTSKGFMNLTVLENIFCERTLKKKIFLHDTAEMIKRANEFFGTLSVDIDVRAFLSELSPARRKLVEIARSICASPRLLLVDETLIDEIKPALGAKTVEKLYYLFSVLAGRGGTIIFCSNNMDHIFSFSDSISIMKYGTIHETIKSSNIDKMQLVQMAYSSILSRKELEKNNFELFYIKQIYEGIINSLALPILVTDTGRNVIIANRSAEKFFQRESESLIQKPLQAIVGITENALKEIEDEIRDMSRTQIDYVSESDPETGVFFFPVLDEVESYMGMLLIFNRQQDGFDIGKEIKSNTEKYNSEQRILKVVHEIKNPLGIILNYLKLIRTEHSRDKIHDNVIHIENEVERISRLLEHLRGRQHMGMRNINLHIRLSKIIDEIGELLIPSIEKNNIELRITYKNDTEITYDPDLVRQIILNVMLNGIEAMSAGGKLTVTCKKCRFEENSFIAVDIRDTGIGITEENLEKIFDPFFTTKSDCDCSGIGLSISQELVQSIGGFIDVKSTVMEGSVFSVFLPVSAPELTC